jgi:hypothetical protein
MLQATTWSELGLLHCIWAGKGADKYLHTLILHVQSKQASLHAGPTLVQLHDNFLIAQLVSSKDVIVQRLWVLVMVICKDCEIVIAYMTSMSETVVTRNTCTSCVGPVSITYGALSPSTKFLAPGRQLL